ncbi:MAG: segregation/condensation protein A [Candidatus Aenigmatarchaeota archaeon]
MDEKSIMDLVTSDYSWEQIIYKIVAWEGMDPWDMDLVGFSNAFINYINKMKEVDFKIPAKYVIIAATLLKMKSDHLHLIDHVNQLDGQTEDVFEVEDVGEERTIFEVNPITMPSSRRPSRKITVNELISSLKKAMITQDRRTARIARARSPIKISRKDISASIASLYERINSIMNKLKNEEVKFSEVVDKWERKDIVDNFIPLLHLDNEKKINCEQEEMFDEIIIKKPQTKNKR